MLQLTNYSKLPSIIFNAVELTPDEKIMLVYLTNRANYFKREEDWFGVPLSDFKSDIGFNDHHKVSETRKSLVDLGLIDYRRGGNAKASQYRVYWNNIYKNLTSRYDMKKMEKPVNNVIDERIDTLIKNTTSTYDISTENKEFWDKLTDLKQYIMREYKINEEEVCNMIINTYNNKASQYNSI